MTHLHLVRSVLFLPASNPRAIAKARESGADLVILDLEDAVKPEDKDSARHAAVEALADDWPMAVGIRINGIGNDWHGPDLVAVSHCGADFVVTSEPDTSPLLQAYQREMRLVPVGTIATTPDGRMARMISDVARWAGIGSSLNASYEGRIWTRQDGVRP